MAEGNPPGRPSRSPQASQGAPQGAPQGAKEPQDCSKATYGLRIASGLPGLLQTCPSCLRVGLGTRRQVGKGCQGARKYDVELPGTGVRARG
jgi:hypothetical protein